MDRQVGTRFVQWGDDPMGELEEKLERLNLDIHAASINNLPMRNQRHNIGVPGHFS